MGHLWRNLDVSAVCCPTDIAWRVGEPRVCSAACFVRQCAGRLHGSPPATSAIPLSKVPLELPLSCSTQA